MYVPEPAIWDPRSKANKQKLREVLENRSPALVACMEKAWRVFRNSKQALQWQALTAPLLARGHKKGGGDRSPSQ